MKMANHDDVEKSCFNCANSFVNDADELVCMVHEASAIDDETNVCDEWN